MRRHLLWLLLPAAAAACSDASAPKPVTCPTASGSTETGTAVTLAVGQSQVFTTTADHGTCLQLDQQSDTVTYLMAIVNTSTNPSSSVSVLVHEGGPGSQAPATAERLAPEPSGSGLSFLAGSRGLTPDELRAGDALHARLLETDRRIVRRRGGPAAVAARTREMAAARLRRMGAVARAFTANVGDTVSLYIRNVNADTDCTIGDTVRARTVYVGPKSVVYEDITAPLAGTMDNFFQQIGQEFDTHTYPMLLTNFGDPLAYDPQLGNKGKVLMLFSPKVNGFGGIAGFVSACDFFPYDTTHNEATIDLVSNEAAIFYAFVPTSLTGTGASGAPAWQAFVRGVLAHESKHLTSYAAKLVNGAPNFETAWLEEATAQTSSEIYQRPFSGTSWKGNGGWDGAVGCEYPLTPYNGCTGDHPQVMLHHFSYLYDYLSNVNDESPIGADANAYYGGSWSFVRWAVDQYGGSEAAILTAINQTADSLGVANLEYRTHVPFADMVTRWSLASALAGTTVTPADPTLALPSWNQLAIYTGMHEQLRSFDLAYPLVPRALAFGLFDTPLGAIPGGGAQVVRLSGVMRQRQGIYLRTQAGAPLATDTPIRVAIVRVR